MSPIKPSIPTYTSRTVFRERTATHYTTLDSRPNPLMEPLVHPPNNRRLKWRWTFY